MATITITKDPGDVPNGAGLFITDGIQVVALIVTRDPLARDNAQADPGWGETPETPTFWIRLDRAQTRHDVAVAVSTALYGAIASLDLQLDWAGAFRDTVSMRHKLTGPAHNHRFTPAVSDGGIESPGLEGGSDDAVSELVIVIEGSRINPTHLPPGQSPLDHGRRVTYRITETSPKSLDVLTELRRGEGAGHWAITRVDVW